MNSPPPPQSAAGQELVVGLGELKLSRNPRAVLLTHALGSCVGVVAWCPRHRVGGLLHFMLPASPHGTPNVRPAMYADTGIHLLLSGLKQWGCDASHLVVKLAGGGVFNDPKGFFAIGERNIRAAQELLRGQVVIAAQDVGGQRSRTVRLQLMTGSVTVRSRGEEYQL